MYCAIRNSNVGLGMWSHLAGSCALTSDLFPGTHAVETRRQTLEFSFPYPPILPTLTPHTITLDYHYCGH